MQVNWIGAGRRDADNTQAEPSRLLNMFREALDSKYVLKGVLGTDNFAQLSGVFMRAMEEVGGEIYAANGGKLYCIKSDAFVSEIGDVTSTADTTISSNNGKVTVASGDDLFVFNGTTRTTPATGAFSAIGSVDFIGQRTILTEKGGRRIQWSGVADAETFDALDFATAEQRDDNIIRGVTINGQYYLFKSKSIERWALTGTSNFIAYLPGSLVDIGLKAFGLYTKVPNGGFFIGTDNIAYMLAGGAMQPVSVRAVETSLATQSPDRCFYHEQEGHKFCVVRFTDRPAWVYDISMNEWHERAEGLDFGPWSAVASVSAYGDFYVGTASGAIRKLTASNYDATQPLLRRAISANLKNGGEFFSLDSVELWGTYGQSSVASSVDFALDAGDGTALDVDDEGLLVGAFSTPNEGAQVVLRLSKDRGETFGKARVKSLGELGEYNRVVRFRALGTVRNACLELTVSDPAELAFESAAEVMVS